MAAAAVSFIHDTDRGAKHDRDGCDSAPGSLAPWLGNDAGIAASEKIIALAVFASFWAMFEFATVAGQAVLGGLINDVVPQSLLGRFYGFSGPSA